MTILCKRCGRTPTWHGPLGVYDGHYFVHPDAGVFPIKKP